LNQNGTVIPEQNKKRKKMGLTVTEKIINSHIAEGKPERGSEVGIRIDQTLTQDATGTMAYLQFESMGVPKVKTELSVSYVDHNTVQAGFENADDHKYLQTVAAMYGIVYSRAGNGICHQVHLERFGRPGKTLLGSDSHTPTGGGLGMLAIGAGGLDVAIAMAGGLFYLSYPRIIRINLTGHLKPWVSAKDVILKVLEIFDTKGNVGRVFEYTGEGTETLSVPERATITNMGAECGVTASVFPSDRQTRIFLKAQKREKDWISVEADIDAIYDDGIEIKLDALEPMASLPHSPGNIKRVAEIEGIKVDQVCIGSCTNSSYKDMMTVALVLEGRKAHPEVSFVIAPGSKQVLENVIRDGGMAKLVGAGARIAESACGFCIGNSQSPMTGGVSLRTSNRNFLGRSGTKDARVYLVSPETAAAAVLTGKITSPLRLEDRGIQFPDVKMPGELYIDDGMFIFPPGQEYRGKIFRGPNIAKLPLSSPLPENIAGTVAIKVGDKISTDHIIPAGARMKYRSNVPRYAEFLFEVVDPDFYERTRKIKESGRSSVIVAGFSYGQGSSREHAAMCPMYAGVRAVIAKSIERIHQDNLVNFGILPLYFTKEGDYDTVGMEDELAIENIHSLLGKGVPIKVKNITSGTEFETENRLSERQKKILLAGGALAFNRRTQQVL